MDPLIRSINELIAQTEAEADKTSREAMEMVAVQMHGMAGSLADVLGMMIALAREGRLPHEAILDSASDVLAAWKTTNGAVQRLIDQSHLAKQQ